MTAQEITRLDDLRGFRGAPPLTPAQRLQLQAELRRRVTRLEAFKSEPFNDISNL